MSASGMSTGMAAIGQQLPEAPRLLTVGQLSTLSVTWQLDKADVSPHRERWNSLQLAHRAELIDN